MDLPTLQLEQLVGQVEQGGPRTLIADPGPLVAAQPIVLGETGTDQGYAQPLRGRGRVGVADHQLGEPGAGGLF